MQTLSAKLETQEKLQEEERELLHKRNEEILEMRNEVIPKLIEYEEIIAGLNKEKGDETRQGTHKILGKFPTGIKRA